MKVLFVIAWYLNEIINLIFQSFKNVEKKSTQSDFGPAKMPEVTAN